MDSEKRTTKKRLLISLVVVSIVAFPIGYLSLTVIHSNHYKQGKRAMDESRYADAYEAFMTAGKYRDAVVCAQKAMYLLGVDCINNLDYTGAALAFLMAEDYQDASILMQENSQKLNAAEKAEQFLCENDAVALLDAEGQCLLQVCMNNPLEDVNAIQDRVALTDLESELDSTKEEDLAPASRDGLWGYADENGVFVIAPIYEKAGAMNDGVALVRVPTKHELVNGRYLEVKGLWQVIDDQGNILLKASAWEPYVNDEFREGWLAVKYSDGSLGYINAQGRKFLNRTWDSIDLINGQYVIANDYAPSYTVYVLDVWAEKIVTQVKSSEDCTVNSEGFIFERHRQSSTYTLRNFQGQKLLSGIKQGATYTATTNGLPFKMLGTNYLVVGNSTDGFGLYRITGSINNRQIVTLVNTEWEFLCGSTNLSMMKSPDATCGIFSIGEKQYVKSFGSYNMVYGFVNVNGQLISDVQWLEINDFNSDGIAFVRDNRGWGIIDTSGSLIAEPQWQSKQSGGFTNGLCAVKKDNLWGYIDTEGQVVIEPQYTKAEGFSSRGEAIVQKDDQCLLIDDQGNVLIDNCQAIKCLNSGYAVKRENMWQLINLDFQRVF